jgi:hypothetical protein
MAVAYRFFPGDPPFEVLHYTLSRGTGRRGEKIGGSDFRQFPSQLLDLPFEFGMKRGVNEGIGSGLYR